MHMDRRKKLKNGLLTLLYLLSLCCFILEGSSDPSLLTVNKKLSLGNYKPADLVKFQGVYVSERIVKDLHRLLDAARKEGLSLKIVSGYRSYEWQKTTFNRWVEKELRKNPTLTRKQAQERANRYSAQAGHSEHQLGTTVDVLSAENGYQFDHTKKLKFVGWLEKNVRKFNFRISYPEGNSEYQYEPWHIRWFPSTTCLRKTP